MNDYKIAFFVELNRLKYVIENAQIELGNPGVGGTQYMFLLTVKYLNKIYGSNYAVLLTDVDFQQIDKDIPIKTVLNKEEAIRFCEDNSISTLVINANSICKISKEKLNTKVRLFFWAHNTLNWKNQCIAEKNDSIKKIICVSKSQYENMKDTPCFEKCTYINNVIPSFFYNNAKKTNYSAPKVIYVGSIMPQKGVHNLINIWRYVEKEVKGAKLYIYGGASIWNNQFEIGKLGVADKYYDRIISKKLNKIKNKENIHFMGAKGWTEIAKEIGDARVGVVNPSLYMRDETFCISAIELEAHGIPVVSRERNDGLKTTILHEKTGFLEKKDKDIAKRITLLLKDDDKEKELSENANNHASNFIIEREIEKWDKLINEKDIDNKRCKKFFIKSRDARLLDFDFLLKVLYIIKSGKYIDLIRKRIIRKG